MHNIKSINKEKSSVNSIRKSKSRYKIIVDNIIELELV